MSRVRLPDWLLTQLMLGPMVAVIGLLFVGGLVVGFGQSLGYTPSLGRNDLTLTHYAAILNSQEFWVSLLFTLYVAITSTLLATIIAVWTALVLRRSETGTHWITFVYQIPLPVPHLVAAAGIVMLLTQSGLIARLLYTLGTLETPSEFPALIFDRGYVGVILVYVWKEVPFIGLVVLAILRGTGAEYEECARTLGASGWQRFRYVLLPLIMPGLVSTSIIVFAFLFGSFEIPLLLGQRFPSLLPVLAYRAYSDPDLGRRPESMAMGMIITVVVVLLLYMYRRLARGIRGVM